MVHIVYEDKDIIKASRPPKRGIHGQKTRKAFSCE